MKVGNAGKYETSEGSCHQISEGNKDSIKNKDGHNFCDTFVKNLSSICLENFSVYIKDDGFVW